MKTGKVFVFFLRKILPDFYHEFCGGPNDFPSTLVFNFNEFNKKEGMIRVFRWGYPGKNRRIDFSYSLKDVEAIRVEFKQDQGIYYPRIKKEKERKGKRE